MKKTLLVASALIFLIACNDNSKQTTTTTDSAALISPNPDTQMVDHTRVDNLYAPAEGDIMYTENKLRVRRNNAYVDADNDVTLDSGIIVNRKGEATWKDKTIRMEEGEAVNRTGNFFNKAGEKIDDIWNDTKRAVKKTAKAVDNAAEKTGEKVKDAVH
jgi:hypothetical protein